VPLAALAVLTLLDLDPANPAVARMAAVAVLMAGWWVTEAIPIAATALLPVALYPLLGIMPGKEVALQYFNSIIFLFIGGFIMALAMQKWNLHRRIALTIIVALGSGQRRIILGFMIATWFLSMWISNTAATMMIVPMAMAIIMQLREQLGREKVGRFSVGLLIGIAYSASIGGMATLIGTPPNLSFARILEMLFPGAEAVTFASWFLFALPLSTVMLLCAWLLLTRVFRDAPWKREPGTDLFNAAYRKLGKLRYEEGVVLLLFTLMVLLWVFRQDIVIGSLTIPGWSAILLTPQYVDDGTVAILIALALFVIPSRAVRGRLIDWHTASQLQWGIVLLLGGGFALAAGFKGAGLSGWLGGQLTGLQEFPPVVIVLSVCATLTFLTELTSNTATTEMMLPILGSLGTAIHMNPLLLMVPATLSASCAFMMPVATAPNAIVFGTGEVKMKDMIRVGILLNLVGIVLILITIYTLGLLLLHIDPTQFPEWAVAG
jgi:sodium-dependent dicarboxylate transporter 2/3/5